MPGNKNKKTTILDDNIYKELYNSSRDAIMILDPAKGFVAGNPATVEMFRCKDEKHFTTFSPADLSPALQPDGKKSMPQAKQMIGKALKEGSAFFDWVHKRVNEETFPATVLLTKLSQGQLIQATVRDVSDSKKVEKNLAKKLQELEEINKLMIGRELKMIELKKKLQKYENKK